MLDDLNKEAGVRRAKRGVLSTLKVGDSVYSARTSNICDGFVSIAVREHTVTSIASDLFLCVPVGEPDADERWFSFHTHLVSMTRSEAKKQAVDRARRSVEHHERRLNDMRDWLHALEHEAEKWNTE